MDEDTKTMIRGIYLMTIHYEQDTTIEITWKDKDNNDHIFAIVKIEGTFEFDNGFEGYSFANSKLGLDVALASI